MTGAAVLALLVLIKYLLEERVSSVEATCRKRAFRSIPCRNFQSDHRLRNCDTENHGRGVFLTPNDGIRSPYSVPTGPLCLSLVAHRQCLWAYPWWSKPSVGARYWCTRNRVCNGACTRHFAVAGQPALPRDTPARFSGDDEPGGRDLAFGHHGARSTRTLRTDDCAGSRH